MNSRPVLLLLVLGFGILIVLIAVLGFGAIRRADAIYNDMKAAQDSYSEAESFRRGIATDIYLADILLRDYLLDPSPENLPRHRQELLVIRNSLQQRVDDLSARMPQSDSPRLSQLQAEVAGAKGYLLKESADSDLDQAIKSVARGKPYFSPTIANTLLEDYIRELRQRGLQDSYDLLTEREKEILQLLAEGNSNKEIAVMLNLSTNTVDTHRTRIMQKLNLHSSAEIVLYAVRKRIIA